jgi:hypothetical protein
MSYKSRTNVEYDSHAPQIDRSIVHNKEVIKLVLKMAGHSARVTAAYLCCLTVVLATFYSCCSSSYEVQDLKANIMSRCRANLDKKMGSPFPKETSACCQLVRTANVVNICQQFTAVDLGKIALYKWAQVTKTCGNGLPAGTNCAGYVVP